MYNKPEYEALLENFNLALNNLESSIEALDELDGVEVEVVKDELQDTLSLLYKVKLGGYKY